jgi:hypothetical protein
VQFDGLVAGATLVGSNGSHDGSPYLTINQATLAPGASLTVATAFTKTGTGGHLLGSQIYSGNF